MRNNKSIIVLLLVAIIGVVGLTVAYFSSTTTFENEFQTSEYGTTYIEKFTSPDNWLPGDETEKTLEVRNSGSVDEAVRVKVEESWVSKRDTSLPLKQGDNVAALINFINDDDWTKVTVDGEDYYYYYYNYKLASGETTSKLLDKVTFNPLINASTTCSDTVVDGVLKRTCNSDGGGYDGATYTLKFTIETVQYNKYSEAWNTNIIIKEERPHPGTLTLLEKTNPVSVTNYTDGDIHEMYTFEHGATAQTPAQTDYRYIGNDPYNYVYFNCDDLDNQTSETCEVWRIIGVFDVEREVDDEDNPGERKTITETRMKLVSGYALATTRMWDNRDSETYIGSSLGKNDWNGSLMQMFLTEDYYNSVGEAENNGLKSSTRDIIDNAVFYLGGRAYDSTTHYGSTEEVYAWERSRNVYNGRPINWEGKVALMYASDVYMTYAIGVSDACYTNPDVCSGNSNAGWIYKSNVKEEESSKLNLWLLSSDINNTSFIFLVDKYGRLKQNNGKNSIGARPVLYLSADVKIIDGDGSSVNPYKLK